MPAGREAAEQVAKEAGCTLDEGEIIPGSNFYHFSCHHVRRRSTEPHAEVSFLQLQDKQLRQSPLFLATQLDFLPSQLVATSNIIYHQHNSPRPIKTLKTTGM